MSLALTPEVLPLQTDVGGVVRIAGTRVTLDTVVAAFHDGCSAEEIAEQYPVLALSHVYAVIAYYLSHRSDVDAYLEEREQTVEGVRRENERRFDPAGVRARLLARQNQPR